MKKYLYVLLISLITMITCGHALAVCSCKQPAYKDEIDFLTSYTTCLEQCFSSQIEQIRQQLVDYGKRIPALESEINRLNLKIKNLESDRTAVREKK